jgi:hypothetical protein
VRDAAEQELQRGDPRMDLEPYARQLRDRLYPGRDEDDPPTTRTIRDHISSRPSLWAKYVKPRNSQK